VHYCTVEIVLVTAVTRFVWKKYSSYVLRWLGPWPMGLSWQWRYRLVFGRWILAWTPTLEVHHGFRQYLQPNAEIVSRLSCCSFLPNPFQSVRFEAFTAVTMKNVVYWYVALCRSCVNRLHLPTGGSVCSHLLTLVPRSRIFLPWRWRRYVLPKRRLTQDLHSATPQKTTFFLSNLFAQPFDSM
jgi:hypothetical protein